MNVKSVNLNKNINAYDMTNESTFLYLYHSMIFSLVDIVKLSLSISQSLNFAHRDKCLIGSAISEQDKTPDRDAIASKK